MDRKLIEAIIEQNEWREKEFVTFRMMSYKHEDPKMLRLFVPMIYAHWEGFVVDALRTLAKYVNSLELPCVAASTNIIVLGFEDMYKKLSGNQSFAKKIEFTENFKLFFDEAHIVKLSKQINTRSNLNFDVLEELCGRYGFKVSNFKSIEKDINHLVRMRNSIAHGENAYLIDKPQIDNLIGVVRNGMDLLIAEIGSFLLEESFLCK